MLNRFLTLTILAGLVMTACSRPVVYDPNQATKELPKATPSPAPTLPPPKKALLWRCKIMNGEGRTFVGVDSTSGIAESKARQECEMIYRHCTFLDCIQFIDK